MIVCEVFNGVIILNGDGSDGFMMEFDLLFFIDISLLPYTPRRY